MVEAMKGRLRSLKCWIIGLPSMPRDEAAAKLITSVLALSALEEMNS